MAGLLVIGTGRSGTSLVMQTLGRLGLVMPDDPVPASENNLRGTGEAIALRDRFRLLNGALGIARAFRPFDWRAHSEARETLDWLTGYLTTRKAEANAEDFADKFPLIALFLPLWTEAAQRAGIAPRFLWATRGPGATISSLMRTYDYSPDAAAGIWAQRMFYLLRDAPDDTLLLPYELWQTEEAAQLAALAAFATEGEAEALPEGVTYSGLLDHSPPADTALPEGLPDAVYAAVDACRDLDGRRGLLGEILDRGETRHLQRMARLADAILALAPGKIPIFDDEAEIRIALLERLSRSPEGETMDTKAELETVTGRIREVVALNRDLEKSAARKEQSDPPAAAQKANAQIESLKTQIEDLKAESERLRAELAAEKETREADRQALEEMRTALEAAEAETQQVREAYARLAAAYDSQEEDLLAQKMDRLDKAETEASNAQSMVQALRRERDERKTQLESTATLKRELEGCRKERRTALAELEQLRVERDGLEQAFRQSTSWRITAPLRALVRTVRRSS